jgi:lipopolysaccharide heptosyltransferase II
MNTQRLLIVKLGAIGDVVMALAAADAIKKEFPTCHITWLVGSRAAPLLENHPSIDNLWIIDENDFWKKRIFSLFQLGLSIRKQRFTGVYILHWSRLFHLFFWLAGIPGRYGFVREGKSFLLTRRVPYTEGKGAPLQINQYLSVVSDTYIQDNSIHLIPRLFIDAGIASAAIEKARLQGANRPWIIMAPGGGNNPKAQMPERRWPVASFIQLANDLSKETSYAILILGDSSEQLLFGKTDSKSSTTILNLAGELTLMESAALIAQCVMFIGNDSGLLHIAGALGRPHLSFFGPTSPVDKVPAWTPHRVLYRSEPCSPCYKFGVAPPCPYGLKCLALISPQEALSECKNLLSTL